MGVPRACQHPDPVRRLLHRHHGGDHHSGADPAADRAQARHRSDPFRSDHDAEPDDRPAASAARHGAVRPCSCRKTLGRAHDGRDSALAGAADARADRDHLHSRTDPLAAKIHGTLQMTSVALAATLFGPEDLRMVEHPLDKLASGMVRIRFGAGGICGSDMHYFRHARTGDFVVKSPLVLGHEISGEVVEIAGAAASLKVGDRVAVNPSRWCGHCDACREGRQNLCENIYFMGSASKTPHMQGGFANYFDAIPAQCVKIPDHVSYQAAALAEPLAVCLHAVARAGDVSGKRAVLFGSGPIGLLTMLAARRAGIAEVTVVDIAAAPLAFASRLGANHVVDLSKGEEALKAVTPFDVAFEVSGTAAGLASAIGAVRRGGVVVQIGNLPGGQIPTPANAVMAKEIDLRGSFRFWPEFMTAVELIATGGVDVLSLVTAERPLSVAPDAVRLALDRSQSVKVVLTAH